MLQFVRHRVAVGVAMAIAPPEPTPVPVGVPKTGFMTVKMAKMAAATIAAEVTAEKVVHLGADPRGDVNAVSNIPYRHLNFRPARITDLEYLAANLAVQAGYAIGMTASAQSKVGHGERTAFIIRARPLISTVRG